MTCHVTLPRRVALTVAQRSFLALHASCVVTSWQWHFLETQLRASAGTRTATIWRDELEHLIQTGLMVRGAGFSVAVTDSGRAAV